MLQKRLSPETKILEAGLEKRDVDPDEKTPAEDRRLVLAEGIIIRVFQPQDIVAIQQVGYAEIDNHEPVEDIQGFAPVEVHPLIGRIALAIGRSPDRNELLALGIPLSSGKGGVRPPRSKGKPESDGPGLPLPFKNASQGMADFIGRGHERGGLIFPALRMEKVINK